MARKIIILLLLPFCLLEGKSQTICLNMIVKNEEHTILRCLESIKPLIDYWVIVDTGSTDKTQEYIKKYLENIPGELHEKPWVNFCHNRNEALNLAKEKGDYILFMDADEELILSKDFVLPSLNLDAYYFTTRQVGPGDLEIKRLALINNHIAWHWEGLLHEWINSYEAKTLGQMPKVLILSHMAGDRSRDPKKYLKDIQILKTALEKEPDNSRYVFYLAQSYENTPDYEQALKHYEQRASMGGDAEEVYNSLYRIGVQQSHLKYPLETIMQSYSKAFLFRPQRAEPLYRIADCLIQKDNFLLAYLVAKLGAAIPMTTDVLGVQPAVYEWGLLFQYAQCSNKLGKSDETHQAIKKLLTVQSLPAHIRELLTQDLKILEPIEKRF